MYGINKNKYTRLNLSFVQLHAFSVTNLGNKNMIYLVGQKYRLTSALLENGKDLEIIDF